MAETALSPSPGSRWIEAGRVCQETLESDLRCAAPTRRIVKVSQAADHGYARALIQTADGSWHLHTLDLTGPQRRWIDLTPAEQQHALDTAHVRSWDTLGEAFDALEAHTRHHQVGWHVGPTWQVRVCCWMLTLDHPDADVLRLQWGLGVYLDLARVIDLNGFDPARIDFC